MSEKLRKMKDEAAGLIAKGKLDKALEVFTAILAAEPDDLQTLLKLGDTRHKLGQSAEAIEAYQKVARGYAEDGLLLKGIAVCKMILEIDHEHSTTQALLADLYAKKSGRGRAADLPGVTPPPAARPAAGGDEDILVEIEEAAPERELPSIPLFSDLTKNAFIQLMERMSMRSFEPGEFVIREGERGQSFFILSQGKVRVTKLTETGEEFTLAHLGEGAFFGEMALLSSSPRTASVVAEEPCVAFEVSQAVLDEVIASYVSVKNVLLKFYKQRLLSNLLATSPIFKPLTPSQRKDLIEKFKSREVPSGTQLLKQGDPGDGLYLLMSGEVRISTGAKLLAKLKQGDVFGEMSLLSNDPVSADVTTTRTSIVLRLPRRSFSESAATIPQLLAHISELSEARKRTTQAILRGEMEYREDGLVLV